MAIRLAVIASKPNGTADYLGLDYEWVPLDILTGATRTDEFLKINPFGQVPTAVLPDGSILTQSNAIAVHLAESAGNKLFGANAFQRAEVFQWLFWEAKFPRALYRRAAVSPCL